MYTETKTINDTAMLKNLLLSFLFIFCVLDSLLAQNYKCIKTLIGHTGIVYSVAISPDGNKFISGSADGTIKIWDLDGNCLNTLQGQNSMVRSVAFGDGNKIVSGSDNNTIKLWDLDGNCIKTIEGVNGTIYTVVFLFSNIISGCQDNTINIWDSNGKHIMDLIGHLDDVNAVSVSSDGNKIISASDDNTIKIWNSNGDCLNTLVGHKGAVKSIAISKDGSKIISGGGDNLIKIWNFEGTCLKTILGENDVVNQVAITSDCDKIVVGGGKVVKIWNVNGKCLQTINMNSFVNSVAISSDDRKIIIIGCEDGTIKLLTTEFEKNNVKMKPKLPPLINLAQIQFNDFLFNNNNIIDANEKSQISFQLKNTGKGSAYDIVISLSTEQEVKGLNYQQKYKIDELAPNEEKQVVIPITSDFNTENAKVKFIIKTKEANGFDAPDEIINVETAKFLNPLVSVADYNFSSEKGGIAKLGEVINLNFAVQNKGQGEAKNVKIVCALPSSNVFAAGETEFTIPLLKPNESKIINFDFFPNRIYKQSNIPVTIDITESYGKYGESKTCTVPLNTELKQQNEIIVQGTKQESIEIKSVSLLSDIDKNLPSSSNNNTNAIAVVIGNSNYSNTNSVAYAISDAQSMKNYLINVLGFKEGNILFKENATLGDFNTLFGTKENQKGRLANTIKENISDVFIFYAGHGAPSLKDNKGYFVPVECNPNYVENSGYSLDVFYQNLAQLKAKSLTIVLDACFSGANVFDKISPLTIKVIDPVLTMKNAVVIASSSGTEVSTWYDEKQHGMFTYFFLKAIQDNSHSDKNKDGVLTYQELFDYVSDRNEGVPYQAARIHGIEQHPTITGDMKEKAFIKY